MATSGWIARRKGRLPVKLPVSFVRVMFFLESSPRPIGFQACESRIHEIPSQDISILSSFTFRIHGIRGVFINVWPFSTITLVETPEKRLFWIATSTGPSGLISLVPIGSDQLGGFRRWQLRQLNS
jgi:hypothetical protein